MSGWIITRTVGTVTRYRASTGHLTADRNRAEVFESATEALPHAQEGDVIEQASGLNKDA